MAELVRVRGCDNPQRRGDVVFVHGLNGDPRQYWFPPGEPDKFWPAWLGEDLPDIGVWSLAYENAALTPRRFSLARRFLQAGFAMPLMDRADDVLLRLELEGIGGRPLVFVTHSMGGLLVKQLLRTAHDSTNARRKAVAEQSRGVCFIATPHIGSDLAKLAHFFATLLGTNVSIDELRPHEPLLRDLNRWYRDYVSREGSGIKTLSFYEMKPLPRVGLVVQPGDADPGVSRAGLHPLDEDHNSICKLKSRSSSLYQRVLEFVDLECLQRDTAGSPMGSVPPAKSLSVGSPGASAANPKSERPESPTKRPAAPISLFYSYSKKDKALREKLETHLSLLQTQGVVSGWHDRLIEPGSEWDGAISEHLEKAGIILLLVSADFLATKYCRDVEIKRAMERHEAGTARVIPVILRPVDAWHTAPFGKFQALPEKGKAVTTWKNRDEAFANIARGIREAVKGLIDTKHQNESEDREVRLDPNLLALLSIEKTRCRERDLAFFTPNLLLALLGPRAGIAHRLLDRTCPGSAESIVDGLRRYEPVDSSGKVPFTDFEWHDRDDVRAASRRAKQDGRATIDGRYLLLGFLDTESQTRNELRRTLGDDGFERFAKAAESPEIPGTPGVRGLFT